MKRNIVIIIALVFSFLVLGCSAQNNEDIKAEEFLISYGMNSYYSKDKINQETVDILVENYNNLELIGTTNSEINYDKAISIIFHYDDKISGQITIDNKGVCHIGGKNYNYNANNDLYDNALKIFKELEAKNQ